MTPILIWPLCSTRLSESCNNTTVLFVLIESVVHTLLSDLHLLPSCYCDYLSNGLHNALISTGMITMGNFFLLVLVFHT